MSLSPDESSSSELGKDYTFEVYDQKFNKAKIVTVSDDEMTILANISDNYFTGLKKYARHSVNFNTEDARVSKKSFQFILDVCLGESPPILRNDIDIEEIRFLVAFLSLQEVFRDILPPDYGDVITETDATIRNAELEIRKVLYSEENVDHRSDDTHFEFGSILKSMQLDDVVSGASESQEEKSDSEDLVGRPRLLAGKMENDGKFQFSSASSRYDHSPFWGLFPTHNSEDPSPYNVGLLPPTKEGYRKSAIPYAHIGTPQGDKLLQIALSRRAHIKSYLDEYLGFQFLDGQSWVPFVIAGGSVTALLTGMGTQSHLEYKYPDGGIDHYYENSRKHLIKDIDLFLITKDQYEADAACKKLVIWCQSKSEFPVVAVATDQSLTISVTVKDGPHRMFTYKFQVILRLYNSILQVISGFDVDSCSVAWDGKKIYTTQRFVRALQTGYNIADPERQSKTYARRLIKYIQRGFAIAFPGLTLPLKRASTAAATGVMRIIDQWRSFNDIFSIGHDNAENAETRIGAEKKGVVSDYSAYFGDTMGSYIYYFTARDAGVYKEVVQSERNENGGFIPGRGFDIDDPNFDEWMAHLKVEFIPEAFVSKFQYYSDAEDLVEETTPEWHPTSSIPRRLTYRTSNPAGQNTNSFEPLSEEWFGDLYIVNLHTGDIRPELRIISRIGIENRYFAGTLLMEIVDEEVVDDDAVVIPPEHPLHHQNE